MRNDHAISHHRVMLIFHAGPRRPNFNPWVVVITVKIKSNVIHAINYPVPPAAYIGKWSVLLTIEHS